MIALIFCLALAVISAGGIYFGLKAGVAAARRGKGGVAIIFGDALIIACVIVGFTPLRYFAAFGVPIALFAGFAAVFTGAGLVFGAYATRERR